MRFAKSTFCQVKTRSQPELINKETPMKDIECGFQKIRAPGIAETKGALNKGRRKIVKERTKLFYKYDKV